MQATSQGCATVRETRIAGLQVEWGRFQQHVTACEVQCLCQRQSLVSARQLRHVAAVFLVVCNYRDIKGGLVGGDTAAVHQAMHFEFDIVFLAEQMLSFDQEFEQASPDVADTDESQPDGLHRSLTLECDGSFLDSNLTGMQYGIPNGTGTWVFAMVAKGAEPLIDSVYARLRDMILANVLRPGQKLVDRDLAEQLGVSRTPVREALGRLAMMGLVEARSRRGYYVRQYSADELSDLYEFRQVLEVSAARLAAMNASPEHVRKFKRILAELDLLAADPSNRARSVELDIEIHNLIAAASGNASLKEAVQNLLDKVMCFIWVDWVDPRSAVPETIAAAHREHKELITRIIDKDSEGAAEAIGAHIESARKVLEGILSAREDLQKAVLVGGSRA